MHSKQKNAQGKRKTKSKPRPRAQKGGNRKTPTTGIQRSRTTTRTAPIATGAVRSGFFGWKFGAAPQHDEFPEGGLRIVGQLPGSSAAGNLNGDYSGSGLGLWSTNGSNFLAVNPSGASITTYAQPLFQTTSPLASISQFFRRYRFRKLAMQFTGQTPTSSVENRILQVAYERDASIMQSGTGSSLTQGQLVNSSAVRFSSWDPDVRISLISLPKHDRADELWYCSQAGDAMTASVAFDRQQHQGLVSSALNILPTATETVYGTCLWQFEVDLYGFTNVPGPNWSLRGVQPAPLVRSKFPSLDEKTATDRGDRKDSLPDADLIDFVDLTPKSNRLQVQVVDPSIQLPLVRPVQATPPPSARTSSKK